MKIDKLLYEHFAELRLRGEFDTFFAPKLGEEVDALIQSGVLYAILNLRLVKFINSTAIGSIIKANKRFRSEGGELVVGQPSPFCRDVLTKLGIDKLVPMYETFEDAQAGLLATMEKQGIPEVLGDSNVLFHFPDEERSSMMGKNRTGLGTVLSVDHERIRFSWNGGLQKLTGDQLTGLFSPDSPLHVKFQVKLCKKGFFEVDTAVEKCDLSADDTGRPEVSVTSRFSGLTEPDRLALAQFADDLDFLRSQLKDVK